MNDETDLQRRFGDTLGQVLHIFDGTSAEEPDFYFQTAGNVQVDASTSEAVFTVTLIHEPISEEAAVENDSYVFTMDADGYWPGRRRGADDDRLTREQLFEALIDFVRTHWRG